MNKTLYDYGDFPTFEDVRRAQYILELSSSVKKALKRHVDTPLYKYI